MRACRPLFAKQMLLTDDDDSSKKGENHSFKISPLNIDRLTHSVSVSLRVVDVKFSTPAANVSSKGPVYRRLL